MKYLIAVLMLLVIISCSSDKKKTETVKKKQPDNSLTTSETTGPAKLIKYKFQPGDVINYKLTTDIDNIQNIEADSVISSELNQKTEYKIQLDIDNVSPEGIADVTVTIFGITAKANANGQNVEYDSKFIYSSRERMMFSDYESLKNRSYKVRVTQYGEILDITDVDAIIDEMISIQSPEKKPTAEQREQLKQQFIQSGIVPMTEQIFRTTSDKVMRINSSWEQRYPSVIGNFNIENIASFNVLEYQPVKEDTLAKINASLSIQWTGEKNISDQGVTYNFSDPNISGHGTIFFNVTKGFVDHSETVVMMEMEMRMESSDSKQQPVNATKRDRIVNRSKLEIL